ncbi:hypothetical protein ABZ707_31290 [Streptomyces sp. NPDC006923]|uniref:hypothetical protein n=1 Tax=Streptomyces sp. NPDC006923 TaxID=3155355 RepID=UPI0033C4BED5
MSTDTTTVTTDETIRYTADIVLFAAGHILGAFDAVGRDARGRYVSVAYTATLPALVEPTAGDDATAARWWPLDALPDLAFDHAEIVAAAANH